MKKSPKTPKKESLRDLARRFVSPEEYDAHVNEVFGESDRACALTIFSIVDQSLTMLIESLEYDDRFIDNKEALLHGGNAILGGTFAKTVLLHFLGHISNNTRSDLDNMRQIRNAFAHSAVPLQFDHPHISTRCEALINVPAEAQQLANITLRDKYVFCGMELTGIIGQTAIANAENHLDALRIKTAVRASKSSNIEG